VISSEWNGDANAKYHYQNVTNEMENIEVPCSTAERITFIFIISGFGIYGAAVVPDSGVGNTSC